MFEIAAIEASDSIQSIYNVLTENWNDTSQILNQSQSSLNVWKTLNLEWGLPMERENL